MESRPPPLTSILLLGGSLVALAGLLWLWSSQGAGEPHPADVAIVVTDRDHDLLFNATGVRLEARHNTVLDLLLEATKLGNFTAHVVYGLQGHAFVDEIDGIKNEGRCGWVYEVNAVRPLVASDAYWLATGDRVHWLWGCE
ncbi:MAG TPA: DUF4430 domain-containing protein [Candidatus Thermoplasmatota archaeon]|nr:DUF4430 domain-containing protein [Candidatus Thermoplasmatota archaeon]